MISDERFTEIRRLFFAEHLPVGTIATQLGVHRDAVVRAIGAAAFNQRKASPSRASAIDAHKAFVVETLARYPHLRATRLLEMVRGRGYAGSLVQLRRFVATAREAPTREAFLRRATLPGEEAQVDWAHFGALAVGRARRPLVCFVMTLGHSRALYAHFFHDLTTTSFLRGHVLGLQALGGVPRRILYDNLKSAVVERVGDAVRFSPDLLALAAHYHFEPRACAPYRGNEKGKVERAIQYLRHSFFAARSFGDLADLNGQLAAWITDVAHRRLAPGDGQGRTVAVLLAQEQAALLPLPTSPAPVARTVVVRSGKTPYLRFDLNDYSIPHALVGRALELRADDARVRIFDDAGREVASHARSFGAGETVEDRTHLAALRTHKRHARELRGRGELSRLCPSAPKLLEAMLARSLPMVSEVRTLVVLCDRYGAALVDRAIADCLADDLYTAVSIERRVDELRRGSGDRPRPSTPPARGDTSRVAAIDLGAYDAIAPRKAPPK